jgi:hypothetical protein
LADVSTFDYVRDIYPNSFSEMRDGNADGQVQLTSQDEPALSQAIVGGDMDVEQGSVSAVTDTFDALAFDDATYTNPSDLTQVPLPSDTITLRADGSGNYLILRNGTIIFSAPLSSTATSATPFRFAGTNDTLVIDASNGDPIPTNGISFDGVSTANGNTLEIIGSNGNDSITFNNGSVSIGSSSVSFTNVANLVVDPRGGSDSLAINSGTVSLPAQYPGHGILARQFSSLSVASGAGLIVGTDPSRSDMTQISVGSLSIGGTLDLGGNELLVNYAGGSDPVAQIRSWLTSGYNSGAWNGTGIDSSAAAANSGYALGYADGADGIVGGLASGQIEILYTLYGDANLDGVVNSADSAIQQANLNQTINSWDQGDFNYDGLDNSADTALLNANMNQNA